MLPETLPKSGFHYATWDAFKRDLELNSGHFLPVDWWLRVKPKKALPWDNLDMQSSLSAVAKLAKEAW
jgi:hypothetical protein